MRCLNSPSLLNSLENKIIEATPAEAKHVLVVNAGDGRIARAIKERAGSAKVTVVSIYPGMLRYVDDMSAASSAAWDIDWYAAQVARHGPFDFVVLFQLHEFWHGELYQVQRLLRLAKPGALVWTSFLNAQASRMIARFLPPLRLGFSALADPLRIQPNIDFASYTDFVNRAGSGVVEIWGMLDQNAQEYCQNQPAHQVQWDVRGAKVNVGTFADAFLWGAPVVGVAFQMRGGPVAPPVPKISFSPFNLNLLQALLLPYPDYQTREGVLGAAFFEVEAWRQSPTGTLGQLAKLAISQVGGTDEPKRVLLMGSGWGRDLLLLKQAVPAWEWVGFDHNVDLVELGREFTSPAGVTIKTGELDRPLPFEDRSFDLVLSLGYFSSLHESAARPLAKELKRIARGPIFHIEDGRGPEQGMQFKSYSLKAVYVDAGVEPKVHPVLVDGAPVGMYMLQVPAPA